MRKRLTAATCVSHQRSPFIWISDALLTDTFTRFCHHKRHGSNVPGPLEAQRRAARRKNTSLAYASHGAPPVDPALVFGGSKDINWWQIPASKEPAKHAAFPRLPTWLFPNNETPQQLQGSEGCRKGISQSTHGGQAEQLAQCSNLSDIRAWLKSGNVNLRHDPATGEAIWRHMLMASFSAEEIAEYVSDPGFHPRGTSFIAQLLPTMLALTWDVYSWRILRDSIAKAAELGFIGIEDLRTILNTITTTDVLSLRKRGHTIINVQRERIYLVRDILQSLERSKVLRMADLGRPFLSELFSKLVNLDVSGLRTALAPVLSELTAWGAMNDAPMVSQFITRYLRNRCQDTPGQDVGGTMAGLLGQAPASFVRMVLLHTTENLVGIARDKPTNTYKYLFHHWNGVLNTLGAARRNIQLTSKDWTVYRSSPGDFNGDQRLLLFAWTNLHLSRHWRRSHSVPDRLRALDLFGRTMTCIISNPNFIEGGFLKRAEAVLKTLALPDKSVLLRELKLIASGMSAPDISSARSHLEERVPYDLSLFLDDTIYKHRSRRHFSEALAELGECLNHNLVEFRTISRRLIQKSEASFEILSRMLECNIPIKAALSTTIRQHRTVEQRARSQSRDHGLPSPSESQNQSTEPEHHVPAAVGYPGKALALVNHLAVSFATTPVTSPRQALRRVYWCFRFLHRYGAPIEPELTKALWHAGVARMAEHGFGEYGTSKVLLRWILWQVKTVEGEDVARRLLWSPAFRAERRAEMEDLAKPSDEVESDDTIFKQEVQDAKVPRQQQHDEAGTRATPQTERWHFPTTKANLSKMLQQPTEEEMTPLLAELSENGSASGSVVDGGSTSPHPDIFAGRSSKLQDLMILQKIRHVKTDETYTKPFWYDKSARKADWETRAQRRSDKGIVDRERRARS
ncbi:hypothetical protein LTR20_004388 [Exophiala xenobiotica]|nr:hypothetical protein LTS13_010073 [Exophiala xenobiotica]KAK5398727.1 hypothetical protein LTR79_003725 [Exophiala xenobiotica]KAK5421379.1 hypothetical protein LTR90_002869 [Exophiala xenobiotica]KAK5465970.1 hypothetical protein LTR20_004388 [Exophiala xenobiotica]KAK5484087.1 hypothetical protein LTR83_008883 [Exophiala xenobiotica]